MLSFSLNMVRFVHLIIVKGYIIYQGALRMKHLSKLTGAFLTTLAVTVFLHYFILTNFSVGSTEGFTGVVENVNEISKGMFPKIEVSFEVSELLHGEIVKEKRTVKMVNKGSSKFKVGNTYTVKTHKDWLCSFTKV